MLEKKVFCFLQQGERKRHGYLSVHQSRRIKGSDPSRPSLADPAKCRNARAGLSHLHRVHLACEKKSQQHASSEEN